MDSLSGITLVCVNLYVSGNDALANLDGLGALTSVGKLSIDNNDALTDLDGLSALTSVGTELEIFWNNTLPDCEVCELLGQLTAAPTVTDAHDNLDDVCTPVPGSCP